MLSPFRVARLVASEEFDRLLNEVLMNTRPVPLAVRVRLSEQGALAPSALGLALKRLTELTWRPEPPAAELAERLLNLQTPEGSFTTPAGALGGSALRAESVAGRSALRADSPLAPTVCAIAGLQSLLNQIQAMPGARNGNRGLVAPASSRCPVAQNGIPGENSEGNPADGGNRAEAGTDFLPEGLTSRVHHAVERALQWLGQHRTLTESIAVASDANTPSSRGVAVRRSTTDLDTAIDTAVILWQLGPIPTALQALGIESPTALIDTLGLRHHRATATLVESLFAEPANRHHQTRTQSRRAA